MLPNLQDFQKDKIAEFPGMRWADHASVTKLNQQVLSYSELFCRSRTIFYVVS
jgi:hypothetical protein